MSKKPFRRYSMAKEGWGWVKGRKGGFTRIILKLNISRTQIKETFYDATLV